MELDIDLIQIVSYPLSSGGAWGGMGKGNVDLYGVFGNATVHSDIDHTVLPANNTISAYTRNHSPGGATTRICIANA